MGDRNNPIKFGPEWLRNFAQERTTSSSTSQNQANSNNCRGSGEPGASGASGEAGGGNPGSPCSVTSSNNVAASSPNFPRLTSKVLLAKLRYGREEMLALFDRTAEAPSELKYIDSLYQPRGKPPLALNNTFEDELESGPSVERYPTGRGLGRGSQTSDRGRPRMSFVRSPSSGRAHWLVGGGGNNVRMSFTPDDEAPPRPWSSSNGSTANRTSGELAEWAPNKLYRSKRQATNWRQAREEGEEWRSSSDGAPTSGTGRARTNQDKWAERDWGDRPNPDKSQNRNNRRTWVASESQNDELPEWAVDSTEAGAGTFDSSGAFHGYSNDDTNVPKAQEPYPLTRSHTHGSFVRSKTMEEGSEEWWASEKAKKLSPKRFDAIDVKFNKKQPSDSGKHDSSNAPKEEAEPDSTEKQDGTPDSTVTTPGPSEDEAYKKNAIKQKFTESKTFDSLMRTNINLEEANDERGNFQSVMITPNNSLRQKHQNIVSSTIEPARMQTHRPALLSLLSNASAGNFNDVDFDPNNTTEEKLVEDIIDMTLQDKESLVISKMPPPTSNQMMNPPSSAMAAGMPTSVNSMPQMQNANMPMSISNPILANQGLMQKPNLPPAMQVPGLPAGLQQTGLQQPDHLKPSLQQVGITNTALNASLGLSIRPLGVSAMGPPMGMRMQGIPPNMMPNPPMPNPGMNPGLNASGMPAGMGAAAMPNNASGIPGFQGPAGLQSIASSNMTNNSLFMSQNTNNNTLQNHVSQASMYPLHGLQHSGSQASFSMYGNMMTPPPPPPPAANQAEMWYYEDPKKTIQGPFSSKEMLNWYRAGFFTQNLMVRRACDTNMRPLGSYGPVVPFAQVDILSTFPMSSNYEPLPQGPHDNMLNSQSALGLESVDSLWSQPTPDPDMMWMQQAINARNDTHVNNLPMYFWEDQPTTIAPSTLLPEDITKEMKTEDQILAQMRAAQNINTQANMSFMKEPPPATIVASKPEEAFIGAEKVTPNLEELQKLIQKDILSSKPAVTEPNVQNKEPEEKNQQKPEKTVKVEPVTEPVAKTQKQAETKASKQAKNESEKAKAKEASTKIKTKKVKDDKKDEEVKKEEEIAKPEKRSVESSPIKNKKEEKSNKKELEKEKKEWLKEGFTIVKGPEKNNNKESKKKIDETKANEEAERKKKEEERLAIEEEKKRKQLEAIKKQQEQQIQAQQRQATESAIKKAPWSAVANQSLQATNKDGLTLAEIQRLEREKKLEQMKEQQQMMQIIAQQQAVALQREQEMQAGLGWAKKKANNNLNAISQSLAEIQAEARKQAAAAAAAIQVIEEPQTAPAVVGHVPWGNSHNGAVGGFWDTQPNPPPKVEKPQEPKPDVSKPKKKPPVVAPAKKAASPAAEFDVWCSTVLSSWSAKIDVPTFVGFLKDIESPYEVKDYVKCYLGETKDSSDFARQFLERRSKLLRVGMVTPSDDLCSPAIAVNPRTISGSDYQEVKGKGKKTKKNKMLKVDARILGFSVTAAEDRINVGDIDTV